MNNDREQSRAEPLPTPCVRLDIYAAFHAIFFCHPLEIIVAVKAHLIGESVHHAIELCNERTGLPGASIIGSQLSVKSHRALSRLVAFIAVLLAALSAVQSGPRGHCGMGCITVQ